VGPRAVWKIAENLAYTGIRSSHFQVRSWSLYRMSYLIPRCVCVCVCVCAHFKSICDTNFQVKPKVNDNVSNGLHTQCFLEYELSS
jgi:hypothetical protein